MRRTLFAAVTLLVLAVPALSQATPPRPGPYISGFVGVAIPNDTTANSNFPSSATVDDRIEFDPGVNVGAAAGYDFGFMRMEGELSYKHAEMKTVLDRFTGTNFSDVDGRVGALALMGNVFFDLRNPSPITPYVGAGVGFAALHLSDTFGTDFSTLPGTRAQLYRSDDDAVFAWQAGAGMEVAINRILSLDLGYRFFQTSRATFNADTPQETKLRFESHNVTAGIRVKFR